MVGTAPSGSGSTRWRGAGKGGPLGVLRDKRCGIIGKQVLMRTVSFCQRAWVYPVNKSRDACSCVRVSMAVFCVV